MLDTNYLDLIGHYIQSVLLFCSYLVIKIYFGDYFGHN